MSSIVRLDSFHFPMRYSRPANDDAHGLRFTYIVQLRVLRMRAVCYVFFRGQVVCVRSIVSFRRGTAADGSSIAFRSAQLYTHFLLLMRSDEA